MERKNIIKIFVLLIVGIIILLFLDILPSIIKITTRKSNELNIEHIKNNISENNIQKFKANIDNSIKSINIEVWKKDDEDWKKKDEIFSIISDFIEEKNSEMNIFFQILNNTLEFGYEIDYISKSKKYPINVDFTNMGIGHIFLNKEKIELNKQIVLFKKYGYYNQEEVNFNIYEDFKKAQCDKGLVITITFLDITENVNIGETYKDENKRNKK